MHHGLPGLLDEDKIGTVYKDLVSLAGRHIEAGGR